MTKKEDVWCYLKCKKCWFIIPILSWISLEDLWNIMKKYKCIKCWEHKDIVVLPSDYN